MRRRHSATYKVQSRSIIKNHCMLSRSEFFKESSEKFLHELSTMLEVDLFLPGQDIIQQGEEGDKMYFLNWGSVQVMLGDQVVGDVGSGSVFGEMALFSNGKRSCTVRATDTCDCRSVDQHRFQRLLNSYPEERARFEKLIEGRQQETSKLKQEQRRGAAQQNDGGSRLRNITLRSLSVIAKMGMNGGPRRPARGSRNSEGSRNSQGDATPRRAGRPTTWPTMAEVQQGDPKASTSSLSGLAKAVLKLGKGSSLTVPERPLAVGSSHDRSSRSQRSSSDGSTDPGSARGSWMSDSMEDSSCDSTADVPMPEVPEEDIEVEASPSSSDSSSPGSAVDVQPAPTEQIQAVEAAPAAPVAPVAPARRSGLCNLRTSWRYPARQARCPSLPELARRHAAGRRSAVVAQPRRQSASPRLEDHGPQEAVARPPWSGLLPSVPAVQLDLEEMTSDPFVPPRSLFEGLPPIQLFPLTLENSEDPESSESSESEFGENPESQLQVEEPEVTEPRSCFEMHMVRGKFQLGPSRLPPPVVRNRAIVGFWWLEG